MPQKKRSQDKGPSAVSVDIDDDEGDDSKNKKTREKRKKDTSKAKTTPVKKQKVSTTKSQKSSSDGGDKAPTRRETLDLDDFGSDDDFDNVEFEEDDAAPNEKETRDEHTNDDADDDDDMNIVIEEPEKKEETAQAKKSDAKEDKSNSKKRKRAPSTPRTKRLTKAEKTVIWNRHKASLLFLLAASDYSNKVINNDLLQATLLSGLASDIATLVPSKLSMTDLKRLCHSLIKELKNLFSISEKDDEHDKSNSSSHKSTNLSLPDPAVIDLTGDDESTTTTSNKPSNTLQKTLLTKVYSAVRNAKPDITNREAVLLFVACMRAMGGACRFVERLKPLPSKPEPEVTTPTESKKRKKSEPETDSEIKLPECWAEVYCSTEQRWVCVDVVRDTFDDPTSMGDAFVPMIFVFAFENNGMVCDVSRRYCSKWTVHYLEVPDPDWLKATIDKLNRSIQFTDDELERIALEERELQKKVEKEPMPTSQAQFRHHPLYVLPKFIGKYEIIWPEDAEPAGTFKEMPVYWRKNLYKLHTKDKWVQEGRQEGELPVKQMPKLWVEDTDKIVNSDYYGEWQTEPYDPGEVQNGIIPRNEFGNVYMFTPDMVPRGAVHIKLPLKKVAKKLGIDCAEAHVGWEVGRWALPRFEGVVVPAESAKILIEAYWNEEKAKLEQQKQKNKAAKEQEKAKKAAREKAKEYVHARFQIDSPSKASSTQVSTAVVSPTKATEGTPSKTEKKSRTSKKSAKAKNASNESNTAKLVAAKADDKHEHYFPKENWRSLGGDAVEKQCPCGYKVVQEVL